MWLSHTPKIIRRTAWKLWSRGLNLSTAKQDWRKEEVSYPRILWGCNQVGAVLNFFFFFLCSSESSKLRADHCKGHCQLCWKSNPWYRLCKHKRENRSCLHRMQCLGVKNRVHLASYLKCGIWLMLEVTLHFSPRVLVQQGICYTAIRSLSQKNSRLA